MMHNREKQGEKTETRKERSAVIVLNSRKLLILPLYLIQVTYTVWQGV